MKSRLLCWRRSLLEFLRYHPRCGAILSRVREGMSSLQAQPLRRLATLAHAARLCPTPERFVQLNRRLEAILARLDPDRIPYEQLDPTGQSARRDLPKSLIIKAPQSPLEKGLIYTTFENQWLRLLRSGQAHAIAQRYDLLLGPSYSPPPGPEMLLLLKLWPGRVFSLLSNHGDAALLMCLSPRITPIPLLASSWVDPEPFEPYLDTPRDRDIVMLANFSPLKRHWLFFQTLRQLPSWVRVLLLGVPMDGRDEAALRHEASLFGVENRFELIVRPTREQILHSLARSRISLVFSQQEGACIAVTESLFANTPVGLFRTARIGSRDFINMHTGMLLDRQDLAGQLMQFLKVSQSFLPREWALDNISCHVSLALLNRAMRQFAAQDGRPWTSDVVPFAKHTVPTYLSTATANAMQPWYDDFADRYGLLLGLRGAFTRPAEVPAPLARLAA